MQLQFLGTGSAFVPMDKNFQSNMIVHSDNGKHLLIDCGSDARHALNVLGYTQEDIDGVYISHFHADHAGGLEWLGFCRRFSANPQKPKLYMHPSLTERLWNRVMSGGMQCLEGDRPAGIEDYYEIMPLSTDSSFEWESIHCKLVQTLHVYNGPELLPSYGLFITTPRSKVFITTDTQFEPELYRPYYEEADLIFQDCDITATPRVHASFEQLTSLDSAIRAKMWLYHYPPCDKPDAVANGFQGFAVRGQSFEI